MTKYIAYMRVSTQRQKRSGLGLEAQQSIIEHFVKISKGEIIQKFVEAESGKESINRPLLNEAIELCKKNNYTMIVAKIDRLSRNVRDTFSIVEILESRLVACDIPNYPIDSFTLAIFSGMAMRERELISLRTKQALKAKRDRGEIIIRKPPIHFDLYREKAKKVIEENVREYYTNDILVAFVEKCVRQKLSLKEAAAYLNKNLFRTRRGREFNSLSVLRLIRRVREFYLK